MSGMNGIKPTTSCSGNINNMFVLYKQRKNSEVGDRLSASQKDLSFTVDESAS
jgi:hypothetical protein